MRNIASGLELISLYSNGQAAEEPWLDSMQKQIDSQPPVPYDAADAKALVEPSMVSYTYALVGKLRDKFHLLEVLNLIKLPISLIKYSNVNFSNEGFEVKVVGFRELWFLKV